ncbi:MAG: mechanosensitive ion channel [bacterium]
MDFFDQLFAPLVPVLGEGVVDFLIALIILIVGYVVAKLVERIVIAVLGRTTLDNRLARAMDSDPQAEPSVERAIGRLGFYLVMLFVLVAFFRRLGLTFITDPLNQLIADIVAFLPRLIAAAIILAAGYLLARILRGLVTQLARGLGAERLARRVGLDLSLSQLIGTLVYALILIPALIAALNALQIEAISEPATQMLERLLNAIPALFGAALLLILAYFVGRVIAGIVADLLAGLGFNDLMARLGLTRLTGEATLRTPADIVGTLVLVAIMLFAAMEAANLLEFELLATIIAEFLVFGGRLLLAVVILALGVYLANLARDLVLGSGGRNASLMATLARWAVIIFAGAIALEQLGVAEQTVNLAFGLTLGAVAVAAALAFGLGARDVAGREAERFVSELRSAPPEPPRPGAAPDVDLGPEEPPTV